MQEIISWMMGSGKTTEEYMSILENVDTIHRHLKVDKDSKELLTVQYVKKGWLGIGENPDSKALVDKVLERISSDTGHDQYDVFIEMLKEVAGMDIIWKKIEGTYVFVLH